MYVQVLETNLYKEIAIFKIGIIINDPEGKKILI